MKHVSFLLKLITVVFLFSSHQLKAQCFFNISTQQSTAKSCKYAVEEVVWFSSNNVSITYNNVVKSSGGGGWSADAISKNFIFNNGFLQTVVDEVDKSRMIGLNTSNDNSNYSDLEFAFYLRDNGDLSVFENGSNKGQWGTYESGDTLRIAIVDSMVHYINNNNIVYKSTITPSFPLFVDFSISSIGGTLKEVLVGNGTDSVFNAFESNPGTAPTYQWKLNNVNVGTNNSTYTNNLSIGDELECVLTPGASGCSVSNVNSNKISIKTFKIDRDITYGIYNDSVQSNSCFYATESVSWNTKSGVDTYGINNISKNTTSARYDAGALSSNKIEEGGYIETIINENNKSRFIGLNSNNTNIGYINMNYAFFLVNNGSIYIYENGSNQGNWGTYTTGDTLRIAVVGNSIRYIKNRQIIRKSTVSPTFPMYADVSIKDQGGSAENITVSNPTYGRFIAKIEGLDHVNYQWKLNGVDVGTNSPIYTNTSLSTNDSLYCVFSVSSSQFCSVDTAFNSNAIKINNQDPKGRLVFSIRNDSVSDQSCNFAIEEVGWRSINGLTTNGSNNLTKSSSSNGWEAGAFSYNKVEEGGFMQTVINENNTNRMIGLNAVDQNVSYSDIDYALYLKSNGRINVYENGSNRGVWGSYAYGDTLGIAVVGNTIRYLKNNNIIYTSSVTPTLPLYVDLSINTIGGTLEKIYVNNTAYGRYSAFVEGAEYYKFQWKLNGATVGTDSAIYLNTAAANGDTISCDLFLLNTLGCTLDTVASSNNIIINKQSISDDVVFAICSDSVTDQSCNFAYEQVGWQSISGLELTANNGVTKTAGANNWYSGAFSYNKVEEGGFIQTIVNETNTSRMFGLNAVNTTVRYSDIDYAFYLTGGGDINIYENGSNKGNWGSYASGDTLRVSVIGNKVRYTQNGNTVYTSTITPNLPLFADLSINSVGGTLEDIVVNNTTYGIYSAFVDGIDSVSYQWKLNGVNVGTDSSVYVNTSTSTGDTISCDISLLETTGCAPDTLKSSNKIIINSQSLADNVVFAIRNDSVSYPACKYAFEEVGWQSLTAVDLNGSNNVTKVGSSNGWDAGAFSYNKVENGGFAQTVVDETNTKRMFGLNAVNTNVSYQDLDFAFYLESNGDLKIYENGSNKGTWGSYNTGDTLRVAVVGNSVRYLNNGNIIYSSSNTPNLPLFVDFSISTVGGTLKDIVVNNATSGYYSAFVEGVDSVSYQWKLNGATVGTDSSVYYNPNLAAEDTLSCEVMLLNTVGCAPDTLRKSNRIIINEQSIVDDVLFSIRNDSITRFSCLFATEEVSWQTISSLKRNAANDVEKLGTNGWNAGAFSFNKVQNGGFMQTVVNENNTNRMIGLNANNTTIDYHDIDYAFYLKSNGDFGIFENSSSKGTFGSYGSGDTLRIAVINNQVKYYKNSNLIYNSTAAPSYPLFVDMSLSTVGATLEDITVYNGLYGRFSAFVDGADMVSYKWKLNGVEVGSDTAVYDNLALNSGDQITSELSIVGAVGCGLDTMVYSNKIDITEVPFGDFIDFYIDKDQTVSNGCQYALVDASWELEDEVITNGNNVSKPTGRTTFDAMAFSSNAVNNNDFMQFVSPQTSTKMMVGLNNTNTSSSFTDIDYCFYLNRGNLRVYENGSNKGNFGAYNVNDTFRIDVVGNTVRYLKNNQLLYTSAVSPSLPLHIDLSLRDVGSALNDFVIGSATNSKFVAVTQYAGVNPNYQWKLNGVDVGADTNVYFNNNLKPTDIVTCVLMPDYGKCTDSTISSNSIRLLDNPPKMLEPIFTPTATTWLGGSVDWNDPTNWSNAVPFSSTNAIIPNGLGVYPNITDAVSVYTLDIASGASVNASAGSKIKLYGGLENQGNLNTSGARVEINTCKNSTRWNAASTVHMGKLLMNNSKGLKVTAGSIQLSDSLIFKEGIIDNDANQIIFENNASYINASDSSYIGGAAEKIGNQSFDFPLGDSNKLAPISISAPANATDAFKARFYYLNPDSVKPTPYDVSQMGVGLHHISQTEYWTLDRTNGTADVLVTLSWDERSGGVTQMSKLRVARWNGSQWQDHGKGSTSGNNASGSVRTPNVVTSFSPFALASSTPANPLPVTLLDFSARMLNKIVELEWQTTSEINNDYFTIEKSKDGKEWREHATIDGAGNSNSLKSYSDKDYNPFKGLSYYRLKQTDFDGKFEYSDAVAVINSDKKKTNRVYPNPITDWVYIDHLAPSSKVKIYSIDGKLVYSGEANKIDASAWTKGSYELKIQEAKGKTTDSYKLIKTP